MDVKRWWTRKGQKPTPTEIPEKPCPICVHLNNLNRWRDYTPIKPATHGAGGSDWSWHACYEHYEVISAFTWIGLTRSVRSDETDTSGWPRLSH